MSNTVKKSSKYDFELAEYKKNDTKEYLNAYVKELKKIPSHCKFCNKMFNVHSMKSHVKTKMHLKNKENQENLEDFDIIKLREMYVELKKKHEDLLKRLSTLT